MSTEVTVSKAGTRVESTPVTITVARILQFMFDFEQSRAFILIGFMDNASEVGRELWVANGPTFAAAMNRAPVGGSGLAVIKEQMQYIVNAVENTPGKKEQLMADGELLVSVGGDLTGLVNR